MKWHDQRLIKLNLTFLQRVNGNSTCVCFIPDVPVQEVIPDWQQAASNILVAVGKKHINDIMEEILSKFQPGLLPHFFVVKTLASLSDSNGNTQAQIWTVYWQSMFSCHVDNVHYQSKVWAHLLTSWFFFIFMTIYIAHAPWRHQSYEWTHGIK